MLISLCFLLSGETNLFIQMPFGVDEGCVRGALTIGILIGLLGVIERVISLGTADNVDAAGIIDAAGILLGTIE